MAITLCTPKSHTKKSLYYHTHTLFLRKFAPFEEKNFNKIYKLLIISKKKFYINRSTYYLKLYFCGVLVY